MTTDKHRTPTHLQAHFYFLPTHNANAKKIKKSLQAIAPRQSNFGGQTKTEKEGRTHNSTYPKGGVSCFADTFVQAESSVLRMNFCGKNPALRVAANRQVVKILSTNFQTQ